MSNTQIIEGGNPTIFSPSTGPQPLGDQFLSLPPHLAFPSDAALVEVTFGSAGFTGAASLFLGIPLSAGDRIKSFSFNVFGNGSADLSYTLAKQSPDGSLQTVLLTATLTNTPAAWRTIEAVIPTPQPAIEGEIYVITYESSATGMFLGGTTIKHDHPTRAF